MKVVRVPKEEAEFVRKLAEKSKAKDKSRLIVQKGNYVEIPIYDGFEDLFSEYQIVEQENPVFVRKNNLYEILKEKMPKEYHELIPRRYKIIGDIILIKIPKELEESKGLIGKTLLKIHPRCKAVWMDKGKEGMLRRPKVELIAGKGSETIHRESGCLFKLDISKVMYSLGNQHEKMRVAKLVNSNEIVLDMFAGIGYFSIPIARYSKAKVYAIEINPTSYHYLLENIRLNKVDNVIPILGDSMHVTPENFADRVIMGHLYCHEFLPIAIRALDGKGMIHYHESTPEAVFDRPIKRIKMAAEKEGKKVEILRFKKVKNYSPGVLHFVVDAYVY
ncbi:class I SAM-dependent methyltransferase family protein [Archaeoglobales archaeon]|nr:MAG: class I SAM-dependent methyltransferase family protein [Archaeoglobales archaeon]